MIDTMDTIDESEYKREVTHTQYRHGDKKTKKGGWSRILHHHITDKFLDITKEDLEKKTVFLKANDHFVEVVTTPKILPYWGGVLFSYVFSRSI